MSVWKFNIKDVEYGFSSVINHINDLEALIEEKNDYIDELKTKIQELETKIQELEAINDNR